MRSGGKETLCLSISPAHFEERLEAAEDQALRIEGRLAGLIHARVLVHLLFGGGEARLVGPDLPGEHDFLAGLRRNRAAEVGLFAVGNEILPALDDLQAPVLLEKPR